MQADGTQHTGSALSRRRFLRTAVIGGGAAVVTSALPTTAAVAEDTTSGSIELSAIPVTYVSAPLNLQGEIVWSVTKRRTNTFSLTAGENRSTTLSFDRSVTIPGFSGGGRTFKQVGSSAETTNSVSVTSDEHIQVNVLAQPGGDGYATVDDTAFVLLQKPKIFMSGNLSGFKWKFVSINTLMTSTVRALRSPNDPNGHQALLGPQTVNAVLGMYPLLQNTSGRALGLSKPRYKFRGQIIVGPGSAPTSFDRTITSGTTVSVKASTTTVTTITRREGFEGSFLGIITIRSMFEEGRTVETTVLGVQEKTSVNMITTGGSRLSNDRIGRFTGLYWDRLWKTLLVTDEGPITGGTQVLQGQVTDGIGAPVAGAIVALADGQSTYEAQCDNLGRYALWALDRPPAGSYVVYSGDGASLVSLGSSGVTTANVQVFSPLSTRLPPNPYPIE